MNEEMLVIRAKKGDEQAFYSFVHARREQLYRIAYAYFKNEQDALDAIQEVTFRAYRNIRRVKQPEYAGTWLVRIMINYCNNELRKRKHVTPLSDITNNDHPRNQGDFEIIEIQQAVDQLDEQVKQVIILKYFQDFKIKEIAQVLDHPEGTIKTWLNKGLQFLRRELGEKGGTPRE
ncbi:MAG: sigma-70 family RNA polymerase sigma factor [Bacillaceae bacterium]|nr:sigma-70 family RNA polymerase sigma factor [Bacillaceae bacterium]